MQVACIVAVAADGAIGRQNDIPWYLPADLQYFKKVTLGHPVLMGRKCYESIGRPLPKRTNIIITRDPFYVATGCLVVHSVEEALNLAFEYDKERCFIIGGGEIYRQSQPYWDKLYRTVVELEVPDADIFFPKWPIDGWQKTSSSTNLPDEKNEYSYHFEEWEPFRG